MAFNLRSSGPFKMMGSSPVKQKKEIDFKKTNDYSKSNNYSTTTEQDETAGDKAINDPEGMYGPGKGKKLSELSKKELEALGFSPKKIKEIMAKK
jgi:hypothetical protein